jgi:hypothetical protein
MSGYGQSEVTLPVKKYNAIIMRGRELQDALKQCLEASGHFMRRVEGLEATLPIAKQAIEIAQPTVPIESVSLPLLKNIWLYLKIFLAGAVVGGGVVLAVV